MNTKRPNPHTVLDRYYRMKGVGQPDKPDLYVLSLSGGASSAVAADIIIKRYPNAEMRIVFADTRWEDSDNWRFLGDLMVRYQLPIHILRDGRNPLEVAKDERIIPNNFLALCTKRLKTEMILNYVRPLRETYNVKMVVGFDTKDARASARGKRGRLDGAVLNWEKENIQCVFPILDHKTRVDDTKALVSSWGIQLPRAYAEGFSHANCGGRCVKQGQKEWRNLLLRYPERFREVELWEKEMRKQGGKYLKYTILKRTVKGKRQPYTLEQLRLDVETTNGNATRYEVEEQLYERTCGTDCNVF